MRYYGHNHLSKKPYEVGFMGGIVLPGTPKTLVVDDERSLLELISGVLEGRGMKNDRAGSVKEAEEAIRREEYDIVFLDLGLPDGSGFSILDRLMEERPRTLVVVITGMHEVETTVQAIRKGAFDYITKPFSMFLFQERLNIVMEEWKS